MSHGGVSVLVVGAVFKTVERRALSLAGSIPVRLRDGGGIGCRLRDCGVLRGIGCRLRDGGVLRGIGCPPRDDGTAQGVRCG